MFILANLVLIVMAGFIAYWLANQGFFSALLHLVCVIVAGAIAFAVWEPVVTGFLLKGGGFDNYAWGIVLVGVFVVVLFILRMVMDRIAPANVGIPHWANLVFGGGVGAAAGILTVGIFIIGAGHVQSSNKLLGGFRGWARDGNRGGQIVQRDKLWIPFHTLTAEFYGWLSVTSLSTSTPLRHYNPYPDRQATLLRDTYGSGRGQLSLEPGTAKITSLFLAPPTGGRNTYFVRVRFDLGAHDFGEQLTISAAQIRLIGRASGTGRAPVAHPVAWRQHSGYHRFDDTSHFLSSEPGKESTDAMLEFEVPAGFEPRFIQIRGTRFSLPRQVQEATPEGLAMISRGGGTIQASVGGASIQQ